MGFVFVLGVAGRFELEGGVLDVEVPDQAGLHLVEEPGSVAVVETAVVDHDVRARIGIRTAHAVAESARRLDHGRLPKASDEVALSPELAKQAKGKRVGLRIWREGGSLLLSVNNSKRAPEKQG